MQVCKSTARDRKCRLVRKWVSSSVSGVRRRWTREGGEGYVWQRTTYNSHNSSVVGQGPCVLFSQRGKPGSRGYIIRQTRSGIWRQEASSSRIFRHTCERVWGRVSFWRRAHGISMNNTLYDVCTLKSMWILYFKKSVNLCVTLKLSNTIWWHMIDCFKITLLDIDSSCWQMHVVNTLLCATDKEKAKSCRCFYIVFRFLLVLTVTILWEFCVLFGVCLAQALFYNSQRVHWSTVLT